MIWKDQMVPDNTIAIIPLTDSIDVMSLIEKPNKTRDWFSKDFYQCLSLTIGNQYGFILKSNIDIEMIWNGSKEAGSVKFYSNGSKEINGYPHFVDTFGNGIVSINYPFLIKTPSNVNIVSINPPNYLIHNATVLTGVVETDNLRNAFFFNIKIQKPGVSVKIKKGDPLIGILPIPRYYVDSFDVKNANDILEQDFIDLELQSQKDAYNYKLKLIEEGSTNRLDRKYFNGTDFYGNKFHNHQNTIE